MIKNVKCFAQCLAWKIFKKLSIITSSMSTTIILTANNYYFHYSLLTHGYRFYFEVGLTWKICHLWLTPKVPSLLPLGQTHSSFFPLQEKIFCLLLCQKFPFFFFFFCLLVCFGFFFLMLKERTETQILSQNLRFYFWI